MPRAGHNGSNRKTLGGNLDRIQDDLGRADPVRGPVAGPADERVEHEPDHWVQSCCVLCSNGCGLDIGVKDGKIVGVRGRAEDRVNRGRLGPKGLHGWAGQQQPRPAHQPARPRRRRLPRGDLGRGDGPGRPPAARSVRDRTPAAPSASTTPASSSSRSITPSA